MYEGSSENGWCSCLLKFVFIICSIFVLFYFVLGRVWSCWVVFVCCGLCLVVLGCVMLRYVALGYVQPFLLVLHCLTLFFFVLSVVVSCCFRVFRRLNCFVSSSCAWSFRLC